jgi:transposase-like protein
MVAVIRGMVSPRRRIGNIDDMILSLYSRGMTTRDIEAHLREVYGVNASRELISNITDVVVDEIKAWQSRPLLDEVYPILYVDGIRIRVKDNGVVTAKTAYLAIGVDVDGRKHALGCWMVESPGGPAQSWCQGCPCRVLRRPDGPARRDSCDFPRHRGADVCGARHP